MTFRGHSEQRRREVVSHELDATRIDDLAYCYIDEIFSWEALAYASFRNFRLERDGEFNFRLSAHAAVVAGIFEHVCFGDQFGGRWTFWLDRRTETGLMFQMAIFAIEFDQDGRIRYGTEGGSDAIILRNPKELWKARDRLISNVVAAIQDRLAQSSITSVPETIALTPIIV